MVDPTKTITGSQAQSYLQEDIDVASSVVTHYVTTDITQGQYDACVDFVFNLGEGNFEKSTLLKLINSRLFPEASLEFEKWNHSDGVVLEGLTKRREAEKQRFLSKEHKWDCQ